MFFDILKCENIYKKEKANIIWNYEIKTKFTNTKENELFMLTMQWIIKKIKNKK
jgi:hypothetical protein